jgi:polyhydroxyalkanoate synthesis repressor PhaR
MNEAVEKTTFEIKKYPNRRFYDVTRSRHVTLNDLFELVRDGHEIRVQDSRTGADITNVVLTQIILEHDPPKLDLFPPSLLHQAIQANQQMIQRFIQQYFAQALDAFVHSRRQFDEFLSKSGFSAMAPTAPFDWVRMLMPGAGHGQAASEDRHPTPDSPGGADAPLREELEELRRELRNLRAVAASSSRRKSESKISKKKRR